MRIDLCKACDRCTETVPRRGTTSSRESTAAGEHVTKLVHTPIARASWGSGAARRSGEGTEGPGMQCGPNPLQREYCGESKRMYLAEHTPKPANALSGRACCTHVHISGQPSTALGKASRAGPKPAAGPRRPARGTAQDACALGDTERDHSTGCGLCFPKAILLLRKPRAVRVKGRRLRQEVTGAGGGARGWAENGVDQNLQGRRRNNISALTIRKDGRRRQRSPPRKGGRRRAALTSLKGRETQGSAHHHQGGRRRKAKQSSSGHDTDDGTSVEFP
jgi:hypothetical protein